MKEYDHKKIEKKWQKIWDKNRVFEANDKSKKSKFYGLIEFPYPSGEGLHVGHIRSNTAMDIICRKRRMEENNVLYPIGWDAFGLPTENYAIKTGIHPTIVTKNNTDTFRRQLKSLGFSFDWSREINTTDPNYYKWTQWIFLQLFKHGLAYKKKMPINWCPSCKIGLANEEVIDGKCERCGTQTEKRNKEQWMLAITKYADRLDNDLDSTDFLEKIKIQQKNWIGRSEGVNLKFKVKDLDIVFEMYDSIPQTHMAQTFTIIAPEHPMLYELVKGTDFEKPVMAKAKEMIAKRTAGVYEKTGEMDGVFTGRFIEYAPAKRELPIWVASFVVADYGTGVVNCSFHDERDYAFAKKFNIPLHPVLFPKEQTLAEKVRKQEIFYRESDGILEEPSEFKGKRWDEAREDIIDYLVKKGWATRAVNYKLRDWVFSRQHYWGEPIPMVYCENCANKKYNFVFLHGFRGNSQGGPLRWYKNELEKKGYNVFIPDLPNTNTPNIEEQTDFVISNAKINEDTIIVGHSLGGSVLLRVLEKIKKPIAKAVFVDSVLKPNFNDHSRLEVEKAHNTWNFDFKKIKKNAKEFIVLADANYEVIPKKYLDELAQNLNANYITSVPQKRHYTGEKEPEILKIIDDFGWIPVSEKDLPIELPKVEKYQPTDTGESPLSSITKWVNVKCPRCGGKARRETDTMPNWAGSSWYYLAYLCKKSKNYNLKNKTLFDYWLPVNWYNGGMEHTTLHLLYSRFWHKFLFDIGVVPTNEPYKKRTSHGLILAEGGVKMSKSRPKTVVNPDDIVERLGADSLRVYQMFMGQFDQSVAWSHDGIVGARRFIEKVWRIGQKRDTNIRMRTNDTNKKLENLVHRTVKKVSEDIEAMRFNTAISALMICANEMDSVASTTPSGVPDTPPQRGGEEIPQEFFEMYLKILSPFAPHVVEELWSQLGHKNLIATEKWPNFDASKILDEEVTIIVQVNGKVRGQFLANPEISESEAIEKAKSLPLLKNWVENKPFKKVIFVKRRLVNFVI